MSKRYGRQQKRKARAKIAELENELSAKNRFAKTAKRIIEIAHDICPNSICFKPAQIDNPYLFSRYEDGFIALSRGVNEIPKHVSITNIDLYQLEADLRESDFDNAVHFRTRLTNPRNNDIEAGYSISRIGLEHASVDGIAVELAGYMKKAISHCRRVSKCG